MKKTNSTYCTKTKLKFESYEYASVGWSGDKLPVCPHCKMTPYDSDFKKFHKPVYKEEVK